MAGPQVLQESHLARRPLPHPLQTEAPGSIFLSERSCRKLSVSAPGKNGYCVYSPRKGFW